MNFEDEYILDNLNIEDDVDEFDSESDEENNIIQKEETPKIPDTNPKKEPLEVRIVKTSSKKRKNGRINHIITHITEINLFLFMMTIFLCTLQFKKGLSFVGPIISLWIHLFMPSRQSNCVICSNVDKQK